MILHSSILLFQGDLSDPDLNGPGGPAPFDVDDEGLSPGQSDDPPRPGPPGSGP